MAIQNMARQARPAGSHENNATEHIAAIPQPMAQPPCTVPTALPRCSARIVSPISTEPTAHSQPKPRPLHPRVISNCQKLLVNPLRKVNSANQRMVHCKTRARPKRSANNPASQPPTAGISNAAVPSIPASPLVMCHAAIKLGMTKLYTITSMPSSAQPPKVAIKVLRSGGDNSVNQAACPCFFAGAVGGLKVA